MLFSKKRKIPINKHEFFKRHVNVNVCLLIKNETLNIIRTTKY